MTSRLSPPSITAVGGYNPAYPRTNVILEGFAAVDVPVEHRKIAWSSPVKRMARTYCALKAAPIDTDFVFVPSFCHHEVFVAKRMCRRPVVFDPLISRYLTKIHDYRWASRFSIHALTNHLADWLSCTTADYILSDTEEHKRFFCERYRICADKVFPLYVGYNSNDFYPIDNVPAGKKKWTVGFYGSFIPLHGIECIIDAAHILKNRSDIQFQLIGSGHTFNAMKQRAEKYGVHNVDFLGKRAYHELRDAINTWDICLGIFGATKKASLVIPNKVFHYAGCARPIITRDSPAIREIFSDTSDIRLCRPDGVNLAQAICQVLEHDDLRRKIARGAYKTVKTRYSHVGIGKSFKELLMRWKQNSTERR